MVFVLAHLSDPHLSPLPQPPLGDLASKRVLGYVNWLRGRRLIHQRAILDALLADIKANAPDHIAITGDFTNLALDAEIEDARAWLETIAPPDKLTIIPGNHDAYVEGALPRAIAAWHPFMAGDDGAAKSGAPFPFVRRRGPLALVGISSAVPTGAFLATGRVDGRQLVHLADTLVSLGHEGLFRIVLVHHPLEVTRRQWHKRLEDAGALRTVLATAGAELVLHGHLHLPSRSTIAGPAGPIHVFAVPSASADPRRAKSPAAYALHRIEDRGEEGFLWSYERRGFNQEGRIVSLATESFTLSKPHA